VAIDITTIHGLHLTIHGHITKKHEDHEAHEARFIVIRSDIVFVIVIVANRRGRSSRRPVHLDRFGADEQVSESNPRGHPLRNRAFDPASFLKSGLIRVDPRW
jgi:hypothetical protein